MGNTGAREKSQQSVDDSGPTLLQSPLGLAYSGRIGDDFQSGNRTFGGIGDDEDFEFANTSTVTEDNRPRTLPSVIKWDGGGQSVFVTFDDGATKLPMVRSQNNFYTIVNLPEGNHFYKFLVDGQYRCDPKEPRDGSCQNNTVVVKASDFEVFEALAADSAGTESSKSSVSGSPPGSYSQNIPVKYSMPNPAAPPTLPPQLLQVILNTETPLQQCEPTVLPEPNHVMLNHLYALSIKDGVMVMSGTHRYRKKYVTTLLYKPTN